MGSVAEVTIQVQPDGSLLAQKIMVLARDAQTDLRTNKSPQPTMKAVEKKAKVDMNKQP